MSFLESHWYPSVEIPKPRPNCVPNVWWFTRNGPINKFGDAIKEIKELIYLGTYWNLGRILKVLPNCLFWSFGFQWRDLQTTYIWGCNVLMYLTISHVWEKSKLLSLIEYIFTLIYPINVANKITMHYSDVGEKK